MSANDDKRLQSFGLIETYSYRMSKNIVCKKEKKKDKCNNIIKHFKKMINSDDVTKETIKE